MAGRQLDAILRGHEAFNQGDLGPAKDTVTQDVEWGTTGTFPGVEPELRGSDALDAWMETLRAEWEEFEITLVEVLLEKDQDLVVAERLWGKGRGSGIEVDMQIFSRYSFNDQGKIWRRRSFASADEALAEL